MQQSLFRVFSIKEILHLKAESSSKIFCVSLQNNYRQNRVGASSSLFGQAND